MGSKTAAINARITPELKQQLNAYAQKSGKKATDIIEAALISYLGVESDSPAPTPDPKPQPENEIQNCNATQDKLQELEETILNLNQKISDLDQTVTAQADQQEILEGRIELVEDNQATETNITDQNEFLEGISCLLPEPIAASNQYTEKSKYQNGNLINDDQPKLTPKDLARKFNVTPRAITTWLNKKKADKGMILKYRNINYEIVHRPIGRGDSQGWLLQEVTESAVRSDPKN